MKTLTLNHSIDHAHFRCTVFMIAFAVAALAVSLVAQAVVPPPDGGYPNFNTAEGQNALLSLTTGVGNTAVGWFSLSSDLDGSFNTAVGAGTLLLNIGDQSTGEGVENTAVGTAALLLNTTGSRNTALGVLALENNDTGSNNTAIGSEALANSITGVDNTAVGQSALSSNTNGDNNTATGYAALFSNTFGRANTANGYLALRSNTSGSFNTALGRVALTNHQTGDFNIAIGNQAVEHQTSGEGNTFIGSGVAPGFTTGDNNIVLGRGAGSTLLTGSGNVIIGAGVGTAGGQNNQTWIRNIRDTPQPVGAGVNVVTIDSGGRLGHDVSSCRYKKDIKPMDKVSEMLFALEPVTYHYKKEIDPTGSIGYGLIAEDVAKLNPDLALRNAKGEIEGVHYQQINMMLLNEFLKQHRKVQELETTVAQQAKGMEVLTAQLKEQAAQIQKVSAEIVVNKPAPQLAAH